GFGDKLRNEIYNTPALVPVMPWLPKTVFDPPALISAQSNIDGIELSWQDSLNNDSTYYVIYRSENNLAPSLNDPSAIIGKVRKPSGGGTLTFTDTAVE